MNGWDGIHPPARTKSKIRPKKVLTKDRINNMVKVKDLTRNGGIKLDPDLFSTLDPEDLIDRKELANLQRKKIELKKATIKSKQFDSIVDQSKVDPILENTIPTEEEFVEKLAIAQEDPIRFMKSQTGYSTAMYHSFLGDYIKKIKLEYTHGQPRTHFADSFVAYKKNAKRSSWHPYSDAYEFIKLAPTHIVMRTFQELNNLIYNERINSIPSEKEQNYIRTISKLEEREARAVNAYKVQKVNTTRLGDQVNDLLKKYENVDPDEFTVLSKRVKELEEIEFEYTFMTNVENFAYRSSEMGKAYTRNTKELQQKLNETTKQLYEYADKLGTITAKKNMAEKLLKNEQNKTQHFRILSMLSLVFIIMLVIWLIIIHI